MTGPQLIFNTNAKKENRLVRRRQRERDSEKEMYTLSYLSLLLYSTAVADKSRGAGEVMAFTMIDSGEGGRTNACASLYTGLGTVWHST